MEKHFREFHFELNKAWIVVSAVFSGVQPQKPNESNSIRIIARHTIHTLASANLFLLSTKLVRANKIRSNAKIAKPTKAANNEKPKK